MSENILVYIALAESLFIAVVSGLALALPLIAGIRWVKKETEGEPVAGTMLLACILVLASGFGLIFAAIVEQLATQAAHSAICNAIGLGLL